ncbi:unnamed protein product [Kuraishia capsulata CBS 1993]|uniref:EF-hand domain-containing protein n=1 Tax=Kuraishia capsulata CBS 1993 TaxID=1382522 RepID=W6MJW9_9ASCO|nr:uncharacterized protein KUCA_T00002259001 [Kuraishia capsulata CBS 1993]CDK26288.1 unnamed protein product [Kuraishia capsulata CBS 1993]
MSASKLSQEQVNGLRATFDHIDQDLDGKVSVADLKSTLVNLRETPDDGEITAMIKEAGGSTQKGFNFSSFLTLMSSHLEKLPDSADLKEAFEVFSKDGTCDLGELRTALNEAKVRNGFPEKDMTDKDISKVLKEFSKSNGITGKDKFMVDQYLSNLN